MRPIVPSIVFGSALTAFDVFVQGARLTPRFALTYIGGIYAYNAFQCPMEAVHGRESAAHNVFSGAILGFVGVQRGILGVPFVDAYFFYRHPQITPAMAGAMVYGAMGGVLATLGGKPF